MRACRPIATAALLTFVSALPGLAQDDVTTRSGPSAYGGAWITGPASNPLSFLNGPAYRTFGSNLPYDFADFRPVGELDKRLPRWISFGAEERFRFEGYHNSNFKLDNDDSYFLNRLRLQMNLQVSPWLKVTSQVQDARPLLQKPPLGPPNQNNWDLKLAYVEIGDPEKHWISVRVGRQLINYNNTLMANSEWRNQGRSYDAVVTNLRHDRYRLGIFAGSVVIPLAAGISHHREGSNIYGLVGGIDNIIPHSTLEPFVLWRVQPSVSIETTAKIKTGKQDMKAYGLRFKGTLAANLDYSIESVIERGADGPNAIRAYATTAGVARQFNAAWSRPRLFAQYDFASGDNDPSDGIHRTFDTIYPTAHDRLGIVDLFGWQNIKSARGGVTIIPRHRWTLTTQYLDFRLASERDAAYNRSGGTIARDSTGKSGTHIGQEADVYTWYELNRHVNIGGGFGWLTAGRFLSTVTPGRTYSSHYFAINFKDGGS